MSSLAAHPLANGLGLAQPFEVHSQMPFASSPLREANKRSPAAMADDSEAAPAGKRQRQRNLLQLQPSMMVEASHLSYAEQPMLLEPAARLVEPMLTTSHCPPCFAHRFCRATCRVLYQPPELHDHEMMDM